MEQKGEVPTTQQMRYLETEERRHLDKDNGTSDCEGV